jgi:hypothetical protein
MAALLLLALGAYLAIGLLIATPFVARGVDAVDAAAARGSRGFRLLILPGCALLWPWVVRRMLHARREAHRAAMRARRRK